MNVVWRVVLFVVSVLAFCVNIHAELLMNNGFESDFGGSDYGNWYRWGGVAVSTDEAHDGLQSARISGAQSGFSYAGFDQKLAVTEHTDYALSFHFLWNGGFFATNRQICVDWRTSGGTVISSEVFVLGLEGPEALWYFSGSYPLRSPGTAAEVEIRILFDGIQAGGALFFDDFSFVEDTNRIHRLSNIGFEEDLNGSDSGNWAIWGSATRLEWQHRDGAYSMAVRGGWAASGDYAGMDQKVDAAAGETYHADFWYYSDTTFSSGYHTVAFDWRDDAGTVIRTDTYNIDVTNNPAQWNYSGLFELTAPPGTAEVEYRFNYSQIGQDGTHYLDDVRFCKPNTYFHCAGKEINAPDGTPFLMEGIVLSGWLFPEGYLWGIARATNYNSCTRVRNRILEIFGGAENAEPFWDSYYTNFLTEADIEEISTLGGNMIRLPFNYRDISPENNPGAYTDDYFKWFDLVIDWCRANDVFVILDMHCSPGGAADEPSGDPEYIVLETNVQSNAWATWTNIAEQGYACMWETPDEYVYRTGRTTAFNQQRTADIWRHIAKRYVDEPCIIGYELVNEPNFPTNSSKTSADFVADMRAFYIDLTRQVRSIDNRHILFFQGDRYGNRIEGLTPPWDTNMVITVHRYWQEFDWNSWFSIQAYWDARDDYNIPLWLGESGENSNPWLNEQSRLFITNNVGCTWWGWKKMDEMAAAYVGEYPAEYDYVIDHFWDTTIDTNQAQAGFMLLSEALNTANCTYKPGFFASIFDTQQVFNVCSQPYTGHALPGRIFFSDYDIGNQGIAYSDTVFWATNYPPPAWNEGHVYRSDGVDIAGTVEGNGYKVNWTSPGEWIKYTMSVLFPGTYDITLRIQSGGTSQIRLLLDDQTLTGIINLPQTGAWNDDTAWADYIVSGVAVPSAGMHTVKVDFVSGAVDLAYMDISFSSSDYVDGDNDGMDDHWEFSFGGNLDHAADADGDGATNREEFFAFTNPTNKLSRLESAITNGTATSTVSVMTSTNRVYSFQYATNLTDSTWENLATNIPGTDATLSLVVTNDTMPELVYYRIKAETP